ncbi:hypothetical protein LguiA_034860 [Lonicera macranthoides]
MLFILACCILIKMEDDNGLDLTLGLTCSGSSSILKGEKCSSSDARTDEGSRVINLDRANKLIDDFKHFLGGGNLKHDSAVKPEGNFFNNFSSGAVNVDASTNAYAEGFWLASESSEVVQESRSNAGSKRKSYFDEINNHRKKHEGDAHNANLHEKTHISITTDEGSTADNEDVVDSGAKGSNSRLVPHRGSSEVLKEVHGLSNPSGVDFSPEKEFKFVNAPYGVTFFPNSMNAPDQLPRGLNPVGAPGLSSYSLSISERPVNQPVMATNLPAMFGYSPVQVPMLDKSQGLLSHSQQLNPSYVGRDPQHSDKTNDGLKISQVQPCCTPRPMVKLHESFKLKSYVLQHGTSGPMTKLYISFKLHVGKLCMYRWRPCGASSLAWFTMWVLPHMVPLGHNEAIHKLQAPSHGYPTWCISRPMMKLYISFKLHHVPPHGTPGPMMKIYISFIAWEASCMGGTMWSFIIGRVYPVVPPLGTSGQVMTLYISFKLHHIGRPCMQRWVHVELHHWQWLPCGTQYDGRPLERAKGNGSSSQREDCVKRSSTIARATDGPNQASPVIRPGIAADVKFGGCGSFPNLPWVSTTGPGPNGRTISGVMYRYSATQLRIVCACHGSHLSPKEFILHASEEQASPGTCSGLPTIPTSNPATSAQS